LASEDAHELFLLIGEIGEDPSHAQKDLVEQTLKNRGWGEYRIEDAVGELIRDHDAIYESIAGDRWVRSKRRLE